MQPKIGCESLAFCDRLEVEAQEHILRASQILAICVRSDGFACAVAWSGS